jgi:hypothetical protein
MEEKENRYKLYRMDNEQILSMLNWDQHQFIALPITKGLPDGARIDAVNYYFDRHCFLARVYHESFDVVPNGCVIPIADEWMSIDEMVVSVEQYKKAADA